MSSVPQSNRYAPPEAHVEDVPAEGQLELATRGARFGAAVIDVVIILLGLWVASLITPWSPFSAKGGVLNNILGFGFFALLQGFPLATRGQTIGKILLDIRIVRSSGERASIGRLLGLRYGVGSLVNVVPFLGPLYGVVDSLLIFRESRQCLHDNIADTIVVKA